MPPRDDASDARMPHPAPDPPAARPVRGGLLDWIERVGNALPTPATMFLVMALVVALASWVTSMLGVAVPHPKDGTLLRPVNLLTADGIRRMLTEAVRNFTGFAPLGTVLVAMLGIGVAEASGLIGVLLRAFVLGVPRGLLTAAVVFAGIMANQAADAGIIVLPPIAAMLFAAAGRHPLAGLAAAFAGVSGGFSANLLPSVLDVLLAGFTQEAVDASRLLTGYHVQLLGNWYFIAVSTPLLTLVGVWITHRFVEPRLGRWKGGGELPGKLEPAERRALAAAGWAFVATVVAMALLALPPGAPLRAEGSGWIERLRPFFDSMVIWVMLLFFVPGLVYGLVRGSIRGDRDVSRMTSDTMATMGTYIVLAFTCAQFVAWFSWSHLGAILAISGANLLKGLGLHDGPLLVAFVVFAAFLNIFTTSATAKWGVVGPVFVPMFVLLGFTPEATQAVYRIGDSCTNIVTPLMPYMPFILSYANRYDPKAGAGSVVSMMIPYSIAFMVMWSVLLLVFYGLHWPIGPGVGMRLAG